jgi:hypothetical protein
MALDRTRGALIAVIVMAAVACSSAQVRRSEDRTTNETAQLSYPTPTNLRVLPRDMTGQQVHDLMEQWRTDLGVRCSACHGEDLDNVVPAGPRRSRFADDSQPMKVIARLMYTMTEDINRNFIAKVEGSGLPVTCGTCHRGRVSPEPAISPAAAQPPGSPLRLP